jgi:hypothetical protein
MGVKAMMFAMVAGSALVIGLGRRDRTPPPVHAAERAAERPWLSKEAASELIGLDGGPGALFSGIDVGGRPPSPAERARVDEFAQRNDVQISFEIADDSLVAIRASVVFHGGFGYEGADVFALRLRHPHTGSCTGPDTWIDNWRYRLDDGLQVHARVDVNRVDVRWEQSLSADEAMTRADALLGMNVDKLRLVAGDRWLELAPHQFLLEAPLSAQGDYWDRRAEKLGFVLTAHAGRIVEVMFDLHEVDYYEDASLALRAHWGQPKVASDDHWSWRLADREIAADDPMGMRARITIRSRADVISSE